jgi:radical SAM family uncharacterized protein/radical SAM-linked protein
VEDLLQRVERPSRYLGNEINTVRKDPALVNFTLGLAYPDLYEIGMSNTGLHILYYMVNEQAEDVAAERVYLPAPDLEVLLRAEDRPLTTLESRTPLRDLDLLGIQIPHELSYANIVKMLRLGGIEVWAERRADDEPIVLGGGPGVFGGEAVAPFYDAMLLGDAEEALFEVIAAVRAARAEGLPRLDVLRRLSQITGVYVPRLYEPVYEDGKLVRVEARDGAPEQVFKAVLEDLETAFYPDKAIIPYAETVHNRLGVEVMRGCTVGCRFCQAGMIYRPLRERSPRRIVDLATCGLGATGYEDVSLLSLDTGDYTLIDPLTKELLEVTADKRISLSLPSLRAGSLTDDVIRDIRRVRRTSFTIAPEAGTQRMRDVINKNISDEEIFETIDRVARAGWKAVKLYFMVGFPTETDEDLDGLVDLVTRCRDLGRRHVQTFKVTASLGTLVPKPHTPFQWDEQLSVEESRRRVIRIMGALKDRNIGCKFHDPGHSWLEGVFSRADRRLAPVIADAEARGAGFESWDNRMDLDLWRQAFADHDLDPESYLASRDYDAVLPWDHLSARVTKKFLLSDRRKVDRLAAPTTFDCRDDLCAGCSACFTDDIRNRLAKYHPDPFADGRRLPMALTSRVAVGQGVANQVRDQAAKAGPDAVAAQLRRSRRPHKPSARRWAVTPGAPGSVGPAPVFLPEAIEGEGQALPLADQATEQALASPLPTGPLELPGINSGPPPVVFHYRMVYERRGELRWLSHREVMRCFYRLLNRTELPIRYTEGYHPKPKVAFGPPLPVGSQSLDENLDIYLTEDWEPERVLEIMAAHMPAEQGLIARDVQRATGRKSAQAERLAARWSLDLGTLGLSAETCGALDVWRSDRPLVISVRRGTKPRREVDLREVTREVALESEPEGERLQFVLRHDLPSAKPSEVARSLLGLDADQIRPGVFTLLEGLSALHTA